MGRHRRSEPQQYGTTAPPRPARPASRRPSGQHRQQSPARVGMLGASAALTVGAVAMSSGLLGNAYDLDDGNDSADQVQASDGSSSPSAHGTPSTQPLEGTPSTAGSDTATPEKAAPTKPSAPKKSSSAPSSSAPAPADTTTAPPKEPAPNTSEAEPEPKKPATKTPSATDSAEAEVLRLVNQERSKAGCQPLTADPDLARLAGDYSKDMAARDFFDHTDPDGNDPWDRASEYGISDMGGENIARGQANAQSVMDSWMQSEGHRANILNCDFQTLGVGAHFAEGGPWWTQNFGF